MLDIRDHGGSFGGGMPKRFETMGIVDNVPFPPVGSFSNTNSSGQQIRLDSYNQAYIFIVNYYSAASSTLNIYNAKTFALIKSLTISMGYNYVSECFVYNGKLYVSAHNDNLSGSPYQRTDVYDFTTWALVTQFNRGLTGLVKIDGTYIYSITKTPTSGMETYSKIRISDYTFSDITIPGQSSPSWIPILNTGKLYAQDFYNSSLRAIINYDGTIITQDSTILNNWDTQTQMCSISPDGTMLYSLSWSNYRYDGTFYQQDIRAKYFNANTFALIKTELLTANGPIYGSPISFSPGIIHNGGKCLSLPYKDPNGVMTIKSYKIGADKYLIGGTTADANSRKSATMGSFSGRVYNPAYYDGNGYIFLGTTWASNTMTVSSVKSYINMF